MISVRLGDRASQDKIQFFDGDELLLETYPRRHEPSKLRLALSSELPATQKLLGKLKFQDLSSALIEQAKSQRNKVIPYYIYGLEIELAYKQLFQGLIKRIVPKNKPRGKTNSAEYTVASFNFRTYAKPKGKAKTGAQLPLAPRCCVNSD